MIYQGLLAQGVDTVVLAKRLSQALRQNLRTNPDQPQRLRIIEILEDLLGVFTSQQSQAVLEIILLKHAQPAATKSNG